MGMPMEQVPLGCGCPRDVGAGELGLIGAALVAAEEEKPSFWNKQAAAAIEASFKIQPRISQAKNLILFLGDGESHWHPRQAGWRGQCPMEQDEGRAPGPEGDQDPLSSPRIRDPHHNGHPHPKGAGAGEAGP